MKADRRDAPRQPKPQGAGPAKRPGLTRRLAFFHTVAIAVSFAAAVAVLYVTHLRETVEIAERTITEEIISVKTMLRGTLPIETIARELGDDEAVAGNRPLVRLLRGDGTMVAELPEMSRLLPAAAFPAPGERAKKRRGNGSAYLLRSAPLPENPITGRGGAAQVAVLIEERGELMMDVVIPLLLLVAGGGLFAAATSMLIARRGLQPLTELGLRVQEIELSNLGKRIETGSYPEEIAGIAESFNGVLARLQDSFDGLNHFTANLAHELRTPINNLMVETDIALSRPRTVEEYQRVLDSSMEEYQRLALIIDRLLFLARAERGGPEIRAESIDVLGELEEVTDLYGEVAIGKGIALSCFGEGIVWADRELFRGAVSNLVSNALDYTPEGGSVVVSGEQEADLSVRISVSDTGCGIPPEDQARIFDRFYRVDATRGRNREGTGLGLPIVRAIMKMHGGEVAIESEPGKGTTVTLLFPPPGSVDALPGRE